MAECAPAKHYRNCSATGGKFGNSTEKQLGMSVCCELSSRAVVQVIVEKKYLEEINILFVHLTEQEPCYHKCSPDYSRRDKTDLAWCRIAQEIKERKGCKRGEPSTSSFDYSSSSFSQPTTR
jgi:hypothetical protein